MSIADIVKRILGYAPPDTGSLDKKANHQSKPVRRAEMESASMDDIEVTAEYQKVLELINGDIPVIFVTGRAGTGKSTFIHFVRRHFEGKLAVVAPTGVAALNAGGQTINSFFRFPPRVLHPDDIKRVKDDKLYKALRVLVVDEISMVRADVLDSMDAFLRLNGPDKELPFGGVSLVLVGDLGQLPPVVATEEESVLFGRRYQSEFFFSAHALQDLIMAPVELMKVFRQSDPEFIDILSRIRIGHADESILDRINQRAGLKVPTPPPLTLTPTNHAAAKINLSELSSLDGPERVFRGVIEGRFKLEEKVLPAPLELKVKPRARVMFTKNDINKRWVNGTLGTVREIKNDKISVEIEERGRGVVDVTTVSWEQYKYRYDAKQDRVTTEVVGTYSQFPLQPAWAVTIHKAQGKTLAAVRIDLGKGAFAPGQVYVALSRARSLDQIWLETPIQAKDVFPDRRIVGFYRSLFEGREGGSGWDDLPEQTEEAMGSPSESAPSEPESTMGPVSRSGNVPSLSEEPRERALVEKRSAAQCLEALRALRQRLADEHDVPVYVVFADATLVEMSECQPTDETSMLEITGVGPGTLARWGAEFLALLRGETQEGPREAIEAAMDDCESVEITYMDVSGSETTRIIRPREWIDGDRFAAFCDLRGAERDFRVTRIKRAVRLG